jgi:predicted Fe-Mo cluster-binding NifX family protein
MRLVAVASEDNRGLEGEVSAHFGRCPFVTLVEVDGDSIAGHTVVPNPNFQQHRPGAMPRFIRSLGANVILSGGMGPRAVAAFEAVGIDVATGSLGPVRQVVQAYLDGGLRGTVPCEHEGGHGNGDCKEHHQGAGQGPAPGRRAAGRVAITVVDDSGLDAAMDPRFGRAPFFLIVDADTGELEAVVANPAAQAGHGAGTGAAALMSENRVRAVISGRFGPKASDGLRGLGITALIAPEGLTARQALQLIRG